MEHEIIFGSDRDTRVAHQDPAFDGVLHVFDRHWHGIRSATGSLPGRKLAVSHKKNLDGGELRHVEGLICKWGIHTICYQGYSNTTNDLVDIIHGSFSGDIKQFCITHVTSTQFDNHFEMHMLAKMSARLRENKLRRLGSVKPGFASVCPAFWGGTIINLPPAIKRSVASLRSHDTVLIPLENSWRKNLYTNVLAADAVPEVARILLVNQPSFLDEVTQSLKQRVIGFQAPGALLGYMASSALVMNVTLAECQPMSQVEAVAVGTPCLTGPLGLPGFSDHPLGRLTEVAILDNPAEITPKISTIMRLWRSDPTELADMIADFKAKRIAAGLASYRDFLEL
ncbi:MAG: hypothetical protein ABI377_00075 [Devosia sp.]